jgi:hypothetical protein
VSVKFAHHLIRELSKLCQFYIQKIEKCKKEKRKKQFTGEDKESLSESISLLEISSLKLLPILQELLKRMVVESQPSTQTRPKYNHPKYSSSYSSHTGTGTTHMNLSNITSSTNNTSLSNPTLNSLSINSSRLKPASLLSHSAAPPKQSLSSQGKNLPRPVHVPHPAAHSHGSTASNPLANAWAEPTARNKENSKIDMRSIFGFLNNSDWVYNLNIGNIMQISPITLQELLSTSQKELELSRESILDKIALLGVSYFCISTEKRFLYQEVNKNTGRSERSRES